MAAALPSVRGCPCTNPDENQFPTLVFYDALPLLKTLHSNKHILNEEECKSVGKAGVCWIHELPVVIVVKGAVQETLGVLEQYKRKWWYDRAANRIKMLSELYQEKLVTEDEVQRMKGEEEDLSNRVVLVQCTKPPEVVARTTNVLDKYRHNEEARWLRALNELFTRHLLTAEECSEVSREDWRWEDYLTQVLSTKSAEVVQEACQVLEKHGCLVKEWLKIVNELFTRHLLTAEECSEVAGKMSWEWEDHLNHVLLTKPAEVVQEACQVLEKHGWPVKKKLKILNELFTRHLLTAEEFSEVARKGRKVWEDHLTQVLSTKSAEVMQEACQVLEKHGFSVSKKLKTLNELFTRHLLTAEECPEVARKGWWEWEDHLIQVLSTKPAEVVQEACQLLQKHGCPVNRLKTLNELFTAHLLTAEECSEVAGKGWLWYDHLHHVLLTKPAEVVQEACQVLENHGRYVEEELKKIPTIR